MIKNLNFLNKTIMVTGAAGQLGQVLCNDIIKQKGNVIAVDISLKKLKTIAKKNKWNSTQVMLIKADISKSKNVEKAFNLALLKFGKIHGQVNNAAISIFTPWEKRTKKEFNLVMSTNLQGTFNCISYYLKYCIKKKIEGSIVNVSSHYGIISPDPRIYQDLKRQNSEIYGATKGGIIQMTKYFAVNGFVKGAKVRVNSVSPGGILGPLNIKAKKFKKAYSYRCPMKRLANTNEIAKPIIFLLSNDSSYINGHNLVIDGGMSIW